jgi:hypothetical protein
VTRLLLALIAAASVLAGCGNTGSGSHPGWVLHSQVRFFAPDLQTAREPLPRNAFRLFFPYIAGDLYGPATTGDFIHPVINPDYTFEIDFNRIHADLLRSLQPTEFSLDFLRIDPPDTRIARLTPLALQPDGIEQVAVVDWVDATSHERLMLVYVDRPARITGALARDAYTIRYNVRATAPGYVWIARRQTGEGEEMYTEVTKPAAVFLALTPPEPPITPKASLPTPVGTPAP